MLSFFMGIMTTRYEIPGGTRETKSKVLFTSLKTLVTILSAKRIFTASGQFYSLLIEDYVNPLDTGYTRQVGGDARL